MLEYTPIETIPAVVQRLRDNFIDTRDSDTVKSRIADLKKIYFAIKDNEELIYDALEQDFHRPEIETYVFDLNTTYSEILEMISSLPKWLKHKSQTSMPLHALLSTSYTEYIPRGVVLAIAPFNYPWMLGISPVVGAIASGNTVVLKPSEQIPHTAELLARILQEAVPDKISVVHGGVNQVTALLAQKWDLILFTGSETVGKIVAREAAKTLTPVVLELGGKSPAIVTKNHANLDVVLDRVLWGAFVNSGQTCVAVDYLLVEDSVYDAVCTKAVERARQYEDLTTSSEWSHLVNERAYHRARDIVDTSKGKIILNEDMSKWDSSACFVPPTIIKDVSWDDSTMKDELFAPILPILKFSSLADAVSNVTTYHDTPLSLYIFSQDKKEQEYLQRHIRSGGVSVNDTLVHVGIMSAPFGGIGTSGYGTYHGKFSVETFSHRRHVFKQPTWLELLLKIRYPQYTPGKSKVYKMSVMQQESFSRDGSWTLSGKVMAALAGLIAILSIFLLL